MKKLLMILSLVAVMSFVTTPIIQAQCPMCKLSAQSNMQNGGESGKGLNQGILWMLGTPYIIIGVIGFVWYRNRRREGEEELEMPFSEN